MFLEGNIKIGPCFFLLSLGLQEARNCYSLKWIFNSFDLFSANYYNLQTWERAEYKRSFTGLSKISFKPQRLCSCTAIAFDGSGKTSSGECLWQSSVLLKPDFVWPKLFCGLVTIFLVSLASFVWSSSQELMCFGQIHSWSRLTESLAMTIAFGWVQQRVLFALRLRSPTAFGCVCPGITWAVCRVLTPMALWSFFIAAASHASVIQKSSGLTLSPKHCSICIYCICLWQPSSSLLSWLCWTVSQFWVLRHSLPHQWLSKIQIGR